MLLFLWKVQADKSRSTASRNSLRALRCCTALADAVQENTCTYLAISCCTALPPKQRQCNTSTILIATLLILGREILMVIQQSAILLCATSRETGYFNREEVKQWSSYWRCALIDSSWLAYHRHEPMESLSMQRQKGTLQTKVSKTLEQQLKFWCRSVTQKQKSEVADYAMDHKWTEDLEDHGPH